MTIPFIPETAPFSAEQRAWLNGFLAGLYSEAPAQGGTATVVAPAQTLTLLYGSQTGNAEGLAKQARKAAEKAGYTVSVGELGAFDTTRLADTETLLIITSTYGEGEPPDNAKAFHGFLMGQGAPRLEKTRYAVLALGDSNYVNFCQTGKEFDQRLEALGAKRLLARVDCDGDPETPFAAWLEQVLPAARLGEPATNGHAPVTIAETLPPKVSKPAFSKQNPFLAPIVDNRVLNGEGSAKETRHLAFSLEGSGFTYEPGDVLGVYPRNCPELVADLIAAAGFRPDELVDGTRLEDLLTTGRDIARLTLPLAQALAARCDVGVQDFVAEADRFNAYAHGRQILDFFVEFKPQFVSATEFVNSLKKLAPRLYSISSSPRAHAGEVHLTVGRVRYDAHGRTRKGVCSDFLAVCPLGAKVPVYLQANAHFKLPASDVPVIMIGPGTGIAPFRAFLHDRAATGAPGKNWLFFGDQRATSDFLYRDELEGLRTQGILHQLSLAFSRDQERKIYVQHRMEEQGAELFRWLEEGAYVYVCGDASRMAKDVDAALHQVVAREKGIDAEGAAAYVETLKRQKRYLRDVY